MSLFPRELRTERLRFEVATPETLDPLVLYRHCNEDAPDIDEMTRYLTWEPHEHPETSLSFLRTCAEEFEAGETANYAIYPRAGEDGADEFAGMAGLRVEWDLNRAEIGTWLRKPFWGRGYSGERARALARVAFDRLDVDCLSVTVNVDNEASRRAIEKYVASIGGREEGLLRNFMRYEGGEVADVYRFSVTREEWAEATGAPAADEFVV
jgi:RimJ/RimL family protein N-acetyltransferase